MNYLKNLELEKIKELTICIYDKNYWIEKGKHFDIQQLISNILYHNYSGYMNDYWYAYPEWSYKKNINNQDIFLLHLKLDNLFFHFGLDENYNNDTMLFRFSVQENRKDVKIVGEVKRHVNNALILLSQEFTFDIYNCKINDLEFDQNPHKFLKFLVN